MWGRDRVSPRLVRLAIRFSFSLECYQWHVSSSTRWGKMSQYLSYGRCEERRKDIFLLLHRLKNVCSWASIKILQQTYLCSYGLDILLPDVVVQVDIPNNSQSLFSHPHFRRFQTRPCVARLIFSRFGVPSTECCTVLLIPEIFV